MSTRSIRRDFKSTDFEETKALITWNAITEPGDRVAGKLIADFGAQLALEKFLKRTYLGQDYEQAYQRWESRYHPKLADEKIALARKHDLKLLTPSDSSWPLALTDLGVHQPVLLWYRGNPENFSALNKSVGVVGSRNASHYGQRITAELVSTLVAEDATVVSGGALGIDSVAHRATLGLNGVTVAFMAGSLDKPYPAANFQLFDEISHSGLLLSEMVPGSNPTRWRFLQRNRLIAAVSNALVVTEAGLRSGSINTVNHAAELDRPIYAIPGPITSPSSAGCNALIRDQLAGILVDVSELPQELGWRPVQLSKTDSMGSLELRALDALTGKAQHFENIRSLSGLTSIELRVALGGLQLLGLAHGLGDQTWRKINPQRT